MWQICRPYVLRGALRFWGLQFQRQASPFAAVTRQFQGVQSSGAPSGFGGASTAGWADCLTGCVDSLGASCEQPVQSTQVVDVIEMPIR